MDGPKEEGSAVVSLETKQAEEIPARWAWVEPEVWTDRMLTALEEGVKGGGQTPTLRDAGYFLW
jgi:RNA-directed DNA polymerase